MSAASPASTISPPPHSSAAVRPTIEISVDGHNNINNNGTAKDNKADSKSPDYHGPFSVEQFSSQPLPTPWAKPDPHHSRVGHGHQQPGQSQSNHLSGIEASVCPDGHQANRRPSLPVSHHHQQHSSTHGQYLPLMASPYDYPGTSQSQRSSQQQDGQYAQQMSMQQPQLPPQKQAPVPIQRMQPLSRSPPAGSSTVCEPDMAAQQDTGPMSAKVVVPARAKPGRKPMKPSEATDRRRKQNSDAQRKFRENRALRLEEATKNLAEQKKAFESQVSDYHRQLEARRVETTNAQAQIQSLQSQLEAALSEKKRGNEEMNHASDGSKRLRANSQATMPEVPAQSVATLPRPSTSSTQNPTPPSEADYHENEVDFTTTVPIRRRNRQPPRPPMPEDHPPRPHADSTSMDFPMGLANGADDDCGFCNNPDNCVCRGAGAQQPLPPPPPPAPAATTAGNCSACRADPARAAACRELASTATAALAAPSSTPRPVSQQTSCSTFIDRVGNSTLKLASIPQLFGADPPRISPAAAGETGYNLSEQQAAAALQNMARTDAGEGADAIIGSKRRKRA